MSDQETRMFYLMLSALEGQKYASLMGYQPPSEDVQKMELMDILSRWVLFENVGILDEVKQASSSFVDLLKVVGKINSPPNEFLQVLEAFSASLINSLLDKNLISIHLPEEFLNRLEDILSDEKFSDKYDTLGDADFSSFFNDFKDKDLDE